jgi:hypothetical protein
MSFDDQAKIGQQRSMLHDAIWSTPVPSSPPPSDPYREALGLNLLALPLRLDHVDRLSESLRLVDSTHMTRSVAVDINLARLTNAQLKALRASPQDGEDLGRAEDYQVCLTGPVPWQADESADDHPLWLQWRTSVSEHTSLTVIDDVIDELQRADIVSNAQLDYCRSRMTGDGRICSAKVSVRLSPGIGAEELPDKLSVLCRATQANVEWKRTHQGPATRSVGLKVAWRERWLGRVKSTGVV